jgi:hypothetical protein
MSCIAITMSNCTEKCKRITFCAKLKKKKTGAGTYKMVNCLSRGTHVLYACFLSGSTSLKMGTHFYIYGRKWREVWMTFSEQKRWSESKTACFGNNRSKTNHVVSRRQPRNFFWLMQANFNDRSQHEMGQQRSSHDCRQHSRRSTTCL